MTVATIQAIKKNLKNPDEFLEYSKTRLGLLRLGDRTIVHMVLQPGWKWSVDIKPIFNTESCEAPHLQYVLSGRLMVRTDDGVQMELKPGDCVDIEGGHDAWVVGNEPFESVDFGPLGETLKRMETGRGESLDEPGSKWFVESD